MHSSFGFLLHTFRAFYSVSASPSLAPCLWFIWSFCLVHSRFQSEISFPPVIYLQRRIYLLLCTVFSGEKNGLYGVIWTLEITFVDFWDFKANGLKKKLVGWLDGENRSFWISLKGRMGRDFIFLTENKKDKASAVLNFIFTAFAHTEFRNKSRDSYYWMF